MDNWYLQQGEQRIGPISLDSLKQMANAGRVSPTDLIWGEGMSTWQAASTMPWFPSVSAAQPPALPGSQFVPTFGVQQYGGQQLGDPGPEPSSLVGWSVAVIILCCIPGGAVALSQARRAKKLWAQGDYAGARSAHKTALITLIVSAVLGLIFGIFYVVAKQ